MRKTILRLAEKGHLAGEVKFDWWIKFWDENGLGHAKPDIFVVQQNQVLLLECKLTQTGRAWDQLKRLYKPLLEHIYQRPVASIQVCKNLRYIPKNLIEDLAEAKNTHTWQCLH